MNTSEEFLVLGVCEGHGREEGLGHHLLLHPLQLVTVVRDLEGFPLVLGRG